MADINVGNLKTTLEASASGFVTEVRKANEVLGNFQQENKRTEESIEGVVTTATQAGQKLRTMPQQAASSFNGLNFQIQQFARELPSLAMSPQMFILAISNNLPMLADEISNVTAKNKALAESGQPVVSTFSQILKGVMSWQTLLIVGITLLTAYGDEITAWISGLGKAKDSLNSTTLAQKGLSDAIYKAQSDAQSEITKLQLLTRATQDSTLSTEERLSAVKQLQDKFPKYFKDLSDEAILQGNVASAYKDTAKAILKKAEAEAISDQITKNTKMAFQVDSAVDKYNIKPLYEAYKEASMQSQADIDAVNKRLASGFVDNEDLVKQRDASYHTTIEAEKALFKSLKSLRQDFIDSDQKDLAEAIFPNFNDAKNLFGLIGNNSELKGGLSSLLGLDDAGTFTEKLIANNEKLAQTYVGVADSAGLFGDIITDGDTSNFNIDKEIDKAIDGIRPKVQKQSLLIPIEFDLSEFGVDLEMPSAYDRLVKSLETLSGEEYEIAKKRVDRLNKLRDLASKPVEVEIFQFGSQGYYSQIIDDLTEAMQNLVGEEYNLADAQLKRLNIRKALATGDYTGGLDLQSASLKDLQTLWEEADEKAKAYLKTLLKIGEGGAVEGFNTAISATEQFVDNLNATFEQGVEQIIGGAFEGLGAALGAALKGEKLEEGELASYFLTPFAGMCKQMGSLLIAYGVSMDAFKKAFSNPYVAIAAGATLVAIGGAISSLAQSDPTSGSTGSSAGTVDTFTGGYSKGTPDGLWDSTRSIEVNVTGRLEGRDIALVTDKYNKYNGR